MIDIFCYTVKEHYAQEGENVMNVTVVLPSLNPDDKLRQTIEGLIHVGFTDIILVNDGSDEDRLPLFDSLNVLPQVTVITHEVNRGKGRGLKTAFAYVLDNRPQCRGVVTVDGDGQHRPEDVLTIAKSLESGEESMLLGTRDFSRPEVPRRSRFGNKTTSLVFRLLCGLRISDTQTGLRGIPRRALEPFLSVPGERFEYETNMLLSMQRLGLPYREIPIETVYIEENASSHFRPVWDSVRIYWLILQHFFRFAGSSLVCFLLDIALFALLHDWLLTALPAVARVFAATAVARVLSSLCNFTLNRRGVFHSTRPVLATLWRYYLLCACQLLCSAALVFLLGLLLPMPETGTKCLVDIVLFFVSYRIQRGYIFT